MHPKKDGVIAGDECRRCHIAVCSQASEQSSPTGSLDNIPHVLLCKSPENCQDDKRQFLLKKKQLDAEAARQAADSQEYPTKLAMAKLKAANLSMNNEMTPST